MASQGSREGMVHVTSKGQATIPASLRHRFGIQSPGRVRFVEEDGRLVVRPVRSAGEMRGALKPEIPGGTELAKSLREERDQEVAREDKRRTGSPASNR